MKDSESIVREARKEHVRAARERLKKDQSAFAKLEKRFGEGVFARFSGSVPRVACFPTGFQALDDLLTGDCDANMATIVGSGQGMPKGKFVEVFGKEGAWKAQPLDALVLTPEGFKPLGELNVGDVVSSPDGGTQKVEGFFPQGTKEVFRIVTSDGGETRACGDHLWTVSDDKGRERTITTRQMIDEGLSRSSGEWVVYTKRLPRVSPIEFTASSEELPLDPYVLGLLLGDGCLTRNTILFCKPEEDLYDALERLLPGGDRISRRQSRDCVSIVSRDRGAKEKSATWLALDSLGLVGTDSFTKFVPDRYLYANSVLRMQLLRGLIDSDGFVVRLGTGVTYYTSSPRLSSAVEFLVRSLGGLCSIVSYTPKYTHQNRKKDGAPAWRLNIRFPAGEVPVSSKKHLAKWNSRNQTAHRTIRSIEPAGHEECACIRVSNSDGLYITDDFIVTHNSSLSFHLVAAAQRAGLRAGYVDAEHAVDMPYAKRIGVAFDQGKLLFSQPSSAEEGLALLDHMIRERLVGFVVVDSVAALTPAAELKGEMGDQHVGLQARLMSQALRKTKALADEMQVTVLWINQLRVKIGGFSRFGPPPEQTTGGNALRYYADVRLDMRVIRQLKKGTKVVGSMSRVKSVKNKLAAPFRDAYVEGRFGEGIAAIHADDDAGGGDE